MTTPPNAPNVTSASIRPSTGTTGTTFTADHSVTGNPTPTISYRWRQNGANITGATSRTYVAAATGNLTVVVSATNSRGTASRQSAAVVVSAPLSAPANTTRPAISGTPQVGQVLTATSLGTWSGNPAPSLTRNWQRNGVNIAGATAASYSIQPVDGGANIRLRVTATNSQGSATANSAAVSVPALAAPTVTSVNVAPASGSVGTTFTASHTATGNPSPAITYQWRLNGANIAGATSRSFLANASGNLTVVVTATNSQGSRRRESTSISIAAPVPASATSAPSVAIPPWNQIVSSMSQLQAAIAARSNEAEPFRIGLASANWGALNLSGIRTVTGAPLIIGSADYGGLGARLESLDCRDSTRLHFQFLNIDRAGLGTINTIVDFRGAHQCGIEWSYISGGTWASRAANSDPYRGEFGVNVDHTALRSPERIHVRHCAVGRHLGKAIRLVRGLNHEAIGNVIFDNGGDDFYTGNTPGFKLIDNWGSRRRRVYDPGGGKHDHMDFYQIFAGTGNIVRDVTIRGNVLLHDVVLDRPNTPGQGLCAHDNACENFVIEQNIVATQSIWGIAFATDKMSGGANNLCRNNTCIRVIDGIQSSHKDVGIHCRGLAAGSGNNIHHHWQSTSLPAGGGVVMLRSGDDHTGQRSFYGGPGSTLLRASDLMGYAPQPRMITHWDCSNSPPVGAARRFREVVVEGKHPGNQPGPVAAIWRGQYDPRNQIAY